MSKNQSSKGTTNAGIANLLDAAIRAAMSKDPVQRAAGYLILAGLFSAYLVGIETWPIT